MLGAYRDGQVVYVGHVGTGFKMHQMSQLRSMMDKLPWKRKKPPVLYSGCQSASKIGSDANLVQFSHVAPIRRA
ncbi:hypothetical protein [Rhizobium sp. S9]|uniref:ATP dependent DNA ligase n=1 Tax=Rhizobium sp. S9 TaxID=2035454 RepID=UPI0032AEA25B